MHSSENPVLLGSDWQGLPFYSIGNLCALAPCTSQEAYLWGNTGKFKSSASVFRLLYRKVLAVTIFYLVVLLHSLGMVS